MNDLISRQAAIEAIVNTPTNPEHKYMGNFVYMDGTATRQNEIIDIIEALPPAQQAAHWSTVSGQAALCSCCGRASNAKQAIQFAYCPYCGAKMEA